MKVFLASAATESATSSVREMLGEAGHTVAVHAENGADMSDCDATVALVSTALDPERLMNVWEDVKAAQKVQRPVIGATLAPPDDLAAAVADIPHEGAWVTISETDPDPADLLTALGALTNGQHGDELLLDEPSDEEAPEERAGGRIARSLDRVKRFTRKPDADEEARALGTRVFVSYSRRDKLARNVIDDLKSHGFDVWVDESSIPGGDNWRASISRGIRAADVFVVLLSPGVVKNSKYVAEELHLAQAEDKPIVPVRLRRIPRLPEGWDLVLAGVQCIDLYPDSVVGTERLVEELGGVLAETDGLRARGRRASLRVRRAAQDRELGQKVKHYGGAAVAGAAVLGVAFAKVVAEQNARHGRTALDDYVRQTRRLFDEAMEEVQLIGSMTPQEYREEFRPNVMRILGRLEATAPPSPDLVERHNEFVKGLQELIEKHDVAVEKWESGDVDAFQRSINRLSSAWADLIQRALDWVGGVSVPSAASQAG